MPKITKHDEDKDNHDVCVRNNKILRKSDIVSRKATKEGHEN